MKKLLIILLLLSLSLPVCAEESLFTNRDLNADYDHETQIAIALSGDTAQCESALVEIDGGSVTITGAGTFVLSGALRGTVIVNAGKEAKLRIVLNNAHIDSENAALYIESADKVVLTLAQGSENTLRSASDTALFSREDLSINGSGSLNVTSPAGHGIVSKDDLVIAGGTITVDAASHALKANDSVRVKDGSLTLKAGKDGIHAENSDDNALGFVYLEGGTFDIAADGDGVSAGGSLTVAGGSYTITAGGGSVSAGSSARAMWDFFNHGGVTEEDESTKGLKAAGALTIASGSFILDTADDAVHSNLDVTVTGGDFTIAAGDDAFHADNALTVVGGNINITQSYEGLEGHTVTILGGDIAVTASDDGVNAAGGSDESGFGRGRDMFAVDENAFIRIAGGVLRVNAEGDGLDSNGALYMEGGEVYISGPLNGGNGSLDHNGEAIASGGVLAAAGADGMAEGFSASSTQGALLVSVGAQKEGCAICLKDTFGNILLEWTPQVRYSCVVITCPAMVENGTYTLTAGTYAGEITLNGTTYGEDGFGGPGGGRMDRKNDPRRERPNGQEPPEMPDGQKPPELPKDDRLI